MENKNKISKETVTMLIAIITLVVAIIAAYYTIKAFYDNRPPKLCFEFRYKGNSINVDDIDVFIIYVVPYYSALNLKVFYSIEDAHNGIPYIYNNSNKMMKNLSMEINVISRNMSPGWIQKDYEVIEKHSQPDNGRDHIYLRYKDDYLYAQSSILPPINYMSANRDYDTLSQGKHAWAKLDYEIAYDGIPKPKNFRVEYHTYFEKEKSMKSSSNTDEYIEAFLDECYIDECFQKNSKSLVLILDKSQATIVNPPKRLTDNKFEKFKKEFIESRKID